MAKDYFYISHYGRKGMKWGKNIFGDEEDPVTRWRRAAAQQQATNNSSVADRWRQEATRQQASNNASATDRYRQTAAQQKIGRMHNALATNPSSGKVLQNWLQRNRINRESDPNVQALRNAITRSTLNRASNSDAGKQASANSRYIEKMTGAKLTPRSSPIGPDPFKMGKAAENQTRMNNTLSNRSAGLERSAANTKTPNGTSIRDKAHDLELRKKFQDNLNAAYGKDIAAANQKAAMAAASGGAYAKNAGEEKMKEEKAAFDEAMTREESKGMTPERIAQELQRNVANITSDELKRWKEEEPEDFKACQYLMKMTTGMSMEEYAAKYRKPSAKTYRSELVTK